MSLTDSPRPVLDRELAQRLERLAARRPPSAEGKGRSPAPADKPASAGRRRRHPAKKSRIAALALSLATTSGLTAGFALLDPSPTSVVTAPGGIVAAPPVAAVTATAPGVVVNGDVYTNKWGPVQVQVEFAPDGAITAVDAIQTPNDRDKSIRINDRAVPVLNSEALTSQRAAVDTVSGATYTSVDYERSMQSAIDAARANGLTQLT